MLKIGELLTLNDKNTYVVVSSVLYEGKNYVYLINEKDFSNVMICLYDNNNELRKIDDPILIEKLRVLFLK